MGRTTGLFHIPRPGYVCVLRLSLDPRSLRQGQRNENRLSLLSVSSFRCDHRGNDMAKSKRTAR
jgi:hypothetical protein